MKAAKVLSVLLAGAMSTGMVLAESGSLQNMKNRWEKRHAQREEIREKIEGELKKQDAQLEKVQSDLKAASADKKVEALTAAVNVLIDQRREMHQKMESLGHKLKGASDNLEKKLFNEGNGNQPGQPGNGSALPSPAPAH